MLIYAGGYQLIFAVYQMSIKSEIKAYLLKNPDSKFNSVFTFSVNNGKINDTMMKWEEMGEEFWYNGKLYDVVSIEYHQSSAVVHCINDKAESTLINQSFSILQKQNQKSSGSLAQFHKLLMSTFETSYVKYIFYFFQSGNSFHVSNDSFSVSNLSEILKPPPRNKRAVA